MSAIKLAPPWPVDGTSREISESWRDAGTRIVERIDRELADRAGIPLAERFMLLHVKAAMLNYQGKPRDAYGELERLRAEIEASSLAESLLYSVIYFQGVTALRMGETENCVMCRGESSCILPISPAARHLNPEGSRLAIRHFTEYLTRFPDDLEVRWLLNLAHMTLGEYPDLVDPRYRISLSRFSENEFDIGRFRDIGPLVGIDVLNQGGGGIMDDFDRDGFLDLASSAFDPTAGMKLFRNLGNGAFRDDSVAAGLEEQFGGIYCVQADYDNDGFLDIFVVRGAWLSQPMRPTLLRNQADGTFSDVTRQAGLLLPGNSISAAWADYDNDGLLDVFVCCEQQPSRLYRNLGNGAFEEVAAKSGVSAPQGQCKGAAWLDYDNDDYPDLFLDFLTLDHGSRLFHNNRDGRFQDLSEGLQIDGPVAGFSCWAWDYNNDGWLDLFATCYEKSVEDVVKGLQGQPHRLHSNRLYQNVRGQFFHDKTVEAGLDLVLETMGSNFGDFDNDGFLDMYLGTGEPDIAALVPNRMFKNIEGRRFSDITAKSGTGSLQKGHGTACGDWDRDGNIDIFIEMGGAIPGDTYHNMLFQNPGHDNQWLTIRLVGQQSNRAAIGARIRIVTASESPLTIHRHVSSGSSFGANPLAQTIGIGKADWIDVLEIHWPSSGTTQVFRNVPVNQVIAVKEFAAAYERLDCPPVEIPRTKKK